MQLAPVVEPVAVGVPLARVRVEAADLGAVAQAVGDQCRRGAGACAAAARDGCSG